MHLIQIKIKPEALELTREYYDSRAIPMLHKVKGCLFARLIQNRSEKTELISLTLWESREYAEKYQDSPVLQHMVADFTPYLAESSEWKVQLSESMELELKPAAEEPVIQSFPVSAREKLKPPTQLESAPMYVRIVSHNLQKGKLEEFKKLYIKEIIPVLQRTQGCLYAYLMENLQFGEKIISVTIWENHQAAEDYEKTGQFNNLIDKVKHTFSSLYRWKMTLTKVSGRELKTSEDMKVDHYQIVSGQEF